MKPRSVSSSVEDIAIQSHIRPSAVRASKKWSQVMPTENIQSNDSRVALFSLESPLSDVVSMSRLLTVSVGATLDGDVPAGIRPETCIISRDHADAIVFGVRQVEELAAFLQQLYYSALKPTAI